MQSAVASTHLAKFPDFSCDPRGTKSSVASSGRFKQDPGDTQLLLGPAGPMSRGLGHSTEPARRLQAGRCHPEVAPGPQAPRSRCRRGDPRGRAGCPPTPGPPESGTAGDRGRPATAFSPRDSGTGPSRRGGASRSPPFWGQSPLFLARPRMCPPWGQPHRVAPFVFSRPPDPRPRAGGGRRRAAPIAAAIAVGRCPPGAVFVWSWLRRVPGHREKFPGPLFRLPRCLLGLC